MLTKILVWCFRILTGATFVFSGFSKAVDPWGTVYKISEYISVWGIGHIPREAIFCGAVGLAMVEFISGCMLMLGCMRKSICSVLAIIMAFMLPLTAYIFFANPVADCGCFGDAVHISNGASFAKNVVLTAMIIYLLPNNPKAAYLYPPLMQWVVAIVCGLYCLGLSIIGIAYQPIVDFRPYKVGTPLLDQDTFDDMRLVYERDGVKQSFGIYELPDSTWTYVGEEAIQSDREKLFSVFDNDTEVTHEVISEDGPQMLYIVTNPWRHNRARASMANRINEQMIDMGGDMIGIVGCSAEQLNNWRKRVNPSFDTYTTDETLLKELVRGDAALVYLEDGVVKWKRNLYSFSSEFPDDDTKLDNIYAVDSGQLMRYMTFAFILSLLFLFALGLLDKIHLHRSSKSNGIHLSPHQ